MSWTCVIMYHKYAWKVLYKKRYCANQYKVSATDIRVDSKVRDNVPRKCSGTSYIAPYAQLQLCWMLCYDIYWHFVVHHNNMIPNQTIWKETLHRGCKKFMVKHKKSHKILLSSFMHLCLPVFIYEYICLIIYIAVIY